MVRALKAGAAYSILVFALGFLLGTARVLLVEPQLGLLGASLIELPLMLLASWLVCGRLVQRFAVPANVGERLAMGLIAFVLLMICEALVSILLMNRRLTEHLATYRDGARQMGLLAQIAFALFPLIRR